MATEIQLRLVTEGLEKAQKDIDRLEKSIQKTKEQAGQLNDEGKALDGVFSAFGSNAVSDFKNLRKSGSDLIKNFGKLRKTGIKGLITGFRGLKTAIASTGIGLLLTLIPDIVEAFKNWASSTEELERAALAANKALDEQRLIGQNILANFDTETQLIKLRGTDAVELANRELERLKLRDKQLQESFDLRNEKVLEQEKLEKETGERNNELTKRLNADAERLLAEQAQFERDLIVAQEALKAAEFDAEKQRLTEVENERRENARKAQERADAEKARLEELQLLRQQARQRELEEEQQFEAKLEQMEEEAFLRTLTDEEREVLAVQDKYFQLITEAEQFGMDTAFLEEEQQLALQEIRDRFAQERRDKEQTNREERQKELDAEFKQEADNAKAIAEANESLQDAKLDAIKGGVEAGKALAGENEQVQNAFFIAEKAVAAGEVIINAIREKAENAVQAQAFGSAFGAAAPAVTAAMLAKLNSGTNLRMGASLATLAATTFAKFKNGGGGAAGSSGGGGAGGVSVGTPQQQTLTPITGQGINTSGASQPVQAFVIGQDITNQQALDSELRLRSTL